jgi:nitrogen fixation/metabolism regulation signal transduction histidine kinase
MDQSPTPTSQRARPRRQLRNFLLDAPFQLKFAGYFVSLTLVVAAGLGVLLVRTTNSLFEQVNASVESRARAAQASRELGTCSLNNELTQNLSDPAFAATLEERSKAIDAAFEAEEAAVRQQRTELMRQQKRTLWVLASLLVAFIAAIGVVAIVITHRIVGPLFRLRRMARDVAEGRLGIPPFGLRPGDELQEVFETFSEMVLALRKQAQDQVTALDAASAGDATALARMKIDLEARLTKTS